MPAKLRHPVGDTRLQVRYYSTRYVLRHPPIHLLYANLEFGTARGRNDKRRLLRWLHDYHHFYGWRWSGRRILSFLEKHQQRFRDCLEWLANDSVVHLDEHGFTDDDELSELWKAWRQRPEVKFLQLHGFQHGQVALWPQSNDGAYFSGLELVQKGARDPLDPICWHLVSLLMVDGTVGVRKCKYAGCLKFFQPRTARRLYHKDACRANDFMSKKSPKEKADDMAAWRKNPMRGRRNVKARHRATP